MAFRPTDEQQAILQHDSENHARVLAGPGTGKSTTMVSLLDSLLEKDNTLRVHMLTFTRAVAAEFAEKISGSSDNALLPKASVDYDFVSGYSLSVTLCCRKSIVEWSNRFISGDPDRPLDHPRPTPSHRGRAQITDRNLRG